MDKRLYNNFVALGLYLATCGCGVEMPLHADGTKLLVFTYLDLNDSSVVRLHGALELGYTGWSACGAVEPTAQIWVDSTPISFIDLAGTRDHNGCRPARFEAELEPLADDETHEIVVEDSSGKYIVELPHPEPTQIEIGEAFVGHSTLLTFPTDLDWAPRPSIVWIRPQSASPMEGESNVWTLSDVTDDDANLEVPSDVTPGTYLGRLGASRVVDVDETGYLTEPVRKNGWLRRPVSRCELPACEHRDATFEPFVVDVIHKGDEAE